MIHNNNNMKMKWNLNNKIIKTKLNLKNNKNSTKTTLASLKVIIIIAREQNLKVQKKVKNNKNQLGPPQRSNKRTKKNKKSII